MVRDNPNPCNVFVGKSFDTDADCVAVGTLAEEPAAKNNLGSLLNARTYLFMRDLEESLSEHVNRAIIS